MNNNNKLPRVNNFKDRVREGFSQKMCTASLIFCRLVQIERGTHSHASVKIPSLPKLCNVTGHIVKHGLDWICKTRTGFVKHGFVKRGFVKRGFVKQGFVKHGFVKHGFVKGGLSFFCKK